MPLEIKCKDTDKGIIDYNVKTYFQLEILKIGNNESTVL